MAVPMPAEAGDSAGAPRYWRLVLILLATFTYAFIDRAILALLVDPIRRDLGATDLAMGLLLGLGFAAFYGVLSIPAGHFVDRTNRRTMIGLASLGWATMTVVCGTSATMAQLFVGRAGVGVAEAVIMPASFSLIRDAVPTRSRGLAFSIFAMGPIIGSTTSLLAGGAILHAAIAGRYAALPLLGGLAPWQCTMVLTGLLGLPISALLLLVREPPRPAPAPATVPVTTGGLAVALRHMRRNAATYVPLILFVTFGAMMNFSIAAWLPAMIGRNWALAPQRIGPLLGSILLPSGLVGLLFSGVILNWLTVRGGDIRIYGLIAVAGTAIGIVGAALAPSLSIALVMVAICQFFIGTSYSVGASTLGQITPAPLMGRVTAIYFLFQSLLGQALGPFMVAFGSQEIASGPFALARSLALCCALFGAAAALAAFRLRRTLQRMPRDEETT